MSKKGLRYVAFGKLKDDGTYENGKHLSPAVNFNATANSSDVKDYGDDRVVETDKSVTGGTISVELNNDEDELYTYLLGHAAATGEGAEIVSNVEDVAPFVGAAAIGQSGSKWVAKVYLKCQFAEPSDENATKEENVAFNHITLEGDILPMENGNWKKRKTFDTFAAAKAYVDELFGISAQTNP
jgi:phi13 family phage major tail protein